MKKRYHKQMFLDVYPSPEKYYKENILEILSEHIKDVQKLANKKRLPITSLLNVAEPFLKYNLYNIWSEVIKPEKRTAEKIQKYYEIMALTLYKQFVETTGKTDINSFKRFVKETIPIIPDEAMYKNLKALEQGIPVKYKRTQVEVERIPVKSWKLEAFTPEALSVRKYVKRLKEEISWREQAIKRVEKELKQLKENRKLMKLIKKTFSTKT